LRPGFKNRQKQVEIDGERIVRGVDGYSDINVLHSGEHNTAVEMLRSGARRRKITYVNPMKQNCNLFPRIRGWSLFGLVPPLKSNHGYVDQSR